MGARLAAVAAALAALAALSPAARAATNCLSEEDLKIAGTYLCFESAATGTIYVDEATGEVVPYEQAVGAEGYEQVVWYESSNLTTPRGATPGSLTSTFINAGTWAWYARARGPVPCDREWASGRLTCAPCPRAADLRVNVTRGVADSAESPQPGNAFTVTSGNFEVSGTLDEEDIGSELSKGILELAEKELGVAPGTVQVDTYATVPERSRGERQTCVLHYSENSGTCLNLAAQVRSPDPPSLTAAARVASLALRCRRRGRR